MPLVPLPHRKTIVLVFQREWTNVTREIDVLLEMNRSVTSAIPITNVATLVIAEVFINHKRHYQGQAVGWLISGRQADDERER